MLNHSHKTQETQNRAVANRFLGQPNSSAVSTQLGATATIAPIQRKVNDFDAETDRYDPPGTDLIETLDLSKFKDKPKQVQQRIREYLNDPLVKTLDVPTKVTAILEPGGKTPARNSGRSRNIGLIGRDEFYIKSGTPNESFEGGHLIPHALWDENDNDVAEADGYQNLVPMSRTLNVMDWADREKEYKDKLKSIPPGDTLKATIAIKHESYLLNLGTVSNRFKLPLANTTNPNEQVRLYGWLPVASQPAWEHIETGSDEELPDAQENELRQTHAKIATGKQLRAALEPTPIWFRMTDPLKDKVKKI